MVVIEEEQVREILRAKACVALMREALAALETGGAVQPPRLITRMPNGAAFGFMPAWTGNDTFGAKVITAYEPNAKEGLPSHLGYVMLFEARHCSVTALVEAGSVTEIRTGAVSAAATDALARPDAHVLALIGAGAQARSHLAAIREVRGISEVRVFDLSGEAAQRFKDWAQQSFGIPVAVCGGVEEAVKDADIICTLTPSKEPFLFRSMVRPGCHVNAVGAFSPVTREVSSDLVAAARLYADSVDAMKRESGEYLVPLSEGLIGEDHIVGSLGRLFLGRIPGRRDDSEITLFDALGLAVEDVAAADYVVRRAAEGK